MKINYYNVGGSAKSTDGVSATAIISETGKSYSSDLHSKNNSILFSPQNFTTMEKSYKSNGITPSQTERSEVQNPNSRKETVYLKRFFSSLALALALLVQLVLVENSHAQCYTATYGLWPSATFTPTCNNAFVNVTTAGYAGEYSNVNLVAGTTYTFRSSVTTDRITVDNNGAAPLVGVTGASGTTGINWICTATGTYRFYTHTNSACGAASVNRTRSIRCAGAAFNPCTTIPTLTCGAAATNFSMAGSAGAWNTYGGAYGVPGQEKLFAFTPTTTGLHNFTVNASAGYVDLFWKAQSSGCNATGWTYVNDILGTETWGINLTAGVTYYIMLDDEDQAANTGSISVACLNPPPACASPTALVSSAITSTSATISWTAPASVPASGYQYFVSTVNTAPTGATVPTGTTAAGVTTANLTSLLANTTYYFWVRSNCGGLGTSPWAGSSSFYTGFVVPTAGSNSYTTCSGTLYDPGITGTYPNSVAGTTTTLYPAVAGNSIRLTFTSFLVETCCDNVKIYNGNSTAAPLIGTYTTSPGVIQSTAANGSLTVQFTSDASVVSDGFTATISCQAPCVPTGNQIASGAGSWIGYVYDAATAGAFTTYKGIVTEATTFNRTHTTIAAGATAPHCSMNQDFFTIRYKNTTNFAAGYYTFTIGGDDGVRLSLDGGATWHIGAGGAPVAGTPWGDHGYTTYSSATPIYLSGNTDMVFEYYENTAGAQSSFSYIYTPACSGTPTPGNTLASATSVVSGGTTNLSLQNSTAPASYQWQSSSSSSGPWSNIAGATSATYTATVSANTWYQCVVTCTASSLFAASSPVQITMLSAINVPTTGSNTVNCGTNTMVYDNGGAAGVYSVSMDGTTVLVNSGTGVITLSGTYSGLETCCDYFQIYAGVGTAGTLLAQYGVLGSGTITTITSAPGQALTIRFYSDGSVTGAGFALQAIYSGTCSSCSAMPSAIVASGSSSTTASVSWTAASPAPASGYHYFVSTANTAPTGASTPTGTTAAGVTSVNLTGLTPNTTYYVWVRSNCGTETSSWAGSASFFTGYCNPGYTFGTVDNDLISNVVIAGTSLSNNTGTTAGLASYNFYSGLSNYTANLVAANSYNVSVTAGSFTNQNFAAWIDYNDNNVFEASEKIGFSTATTVAAFQTVNFPINLSCTPPLGPHRMRVRGVYATAGSTIDPCATYGWGETEDYLITIVTGTSFTPTFTATPTNPSCTNNQLTYTAPSGQTNYSWTFPGVATVDYVLVSGGTATSNTSLVTYLTSGSKTVTLNYSSPLGCASSGAVNNVITVNTTPTVTTVNTASICSGSATNISLTASVASTYAWSVGTITGSITGASSGVGATIAQTLTNPSNSAAGTVQYLVTPTATTGSCAGLAYTITVTVNPSPTVTTANTASICSGNATNISLTASVASAYTWTIGTVTGSITGATQSLGTGTSISQTLTNPSSSAVGTVDYIVTPTATTGSCAGAAYSITVTVNPKPVIANITSSICSGGAFTVTPSIGGGTSSNDIVPANTTYTWSAPSVIGITGTAASTSAPNISGTLTNTTNAPINVVYTVTPTALIGTCAGATFTVTVTVNPTPAALLLTGSIVCFTTPTTITSSTSQSDINYQLYNSSGAVGSVLLGDGNGITWSAMAAGNGYYVIGTNTGTACASVASSTVNVVLNANTNTIQTNLGGVTLGAGDYLWNGSVSLLWENPANWFEFIGSNFAATANVPQDNDRVFILTNFTVGSTCINMDVLNPVSVSVNGAANGLAKDVYIGTGAYMTIAQDETLTVKGNWTNHGTFTANPGSSVVFEGSGAKEILGSTPTTFNNLTVNKTLGGSLTLQTPATVAGTLTMTEGEIVTRISVTPDVTNLLTVGTSAAPGETGSIAWTGGSVLGPIKRYFSEVESLTQSSGIFPVGFLNLVSGLVSNRNAQVNYTANLGTGGSITAEYKSGETPVDDIVIPNPPGADIIYQNYSGLPAFVNGHMIQNYENEGYWEITPERDIFNQPVGDLNTAQYSLKLRGNNLSAVTSIPAMSQLRMIKSTSHTGWDNVGIGSYSFPADIDLTNGVSDFTITNRLMTGFSWFNIGSGQISWLPVELTNFAANCNEKSQVDLKWSTASEQNSENFIIERSRDLTQWEFVSTINAAGNSNYNINYSTLDTDPFGGISYYRLVQVDNNGAEKIYGPISVSCSDTENSIIVFPNPTQGNFTVEISSTEIFTNAQLQITDLTGKVINQRSTNILEGKNQFTFEGLDLQLGTYIINLNSVNGKINPVRIVVD
jgi:hypothetical protein